MKREEANNAAMLLHLKGRVPDCKGLHKKFEGGRYYFSPRSSSPEGEREKLSERRGERFPVSQNTGSKSSGDRKGLLGGGDLLSQTAVFVLN